MINKKSYAHDKKALRQSFPALSSNPVDVSGAGDSLLSVVAVALASSEPLMSAAAIGACRASIAVDNIGNYQVSREALKEKVKQVFEDL